MSETIHRPPALIEMAAVEVTALNGLRQLNAPDNAVVAYRFNARPFTLALKLKHIEPVITVTDRVNARLEETRIVVAHTLALDIEKAGVYSLALLPQAGFVVADVQGDGIEDWKIVEGSLVVNFSQRALGQRQLEVQLEQALKTFPEQISIAPLRVTGAAKESSQIGVAAVPGIRLKTGSISGLREIPINQLPDRGDEILAYASEQPDWQLAIGTEKLAARVVADIFNLVIMYVDRGADDLAHQAVKYQQRDGWSHADLLRLAHPKAPSVQHDAVFRWMLAGADSLGEREVKRKVHGENRIAKYAAVGELPKFIEAFERVKRSTNVVEVVKLIDEFNLPREAVPTQWLNEVAVWEALLVNMPMTAMVRHLGKMTSLGLLKPFSDHRVVRGQHAADGQAVADVRVRHERARDRHRHVSHRDFAEEHWSEHLLIVGPPVGEVLFRWQQPECARTVGGVIHPGVAEENFAMLRDALEQRLVDQGSRTHSSTQQTPEIVVMAGHAEFPGFVRRPESFLVQQAGFFPEGAFRRDDARRESGVGHKSWKKFRDVGLNGFLLIRPIIRASAQLNLHNRTNVAGGSRWKSRWVMEQQALAIGHVGINFEFPAGFTKGGMKPAGQRGL